MNPLAGPVIGTAACFLVNAHRLAVAAAVVLDEAQLELTPELVGLFEDLGSAATMMIAVADEYGASMVAIPATNRGKS